MSTATQKGKPRIRYTSRPEAIHISGIKIPSRSRRRKVAGSKWSGALAQVNSSP